MIRPRHAVIASLALASAALYTMPAYAFELITDDEARLPAAAPLVTRGITRGPAIHQLQPDPTAGPVKSPLALKVAFEPRGGAKIDPASIRLTYLKSTPIDLSERVRRGLSDKGLDLTNAEIPPGTHELQLVLQDTDGRKASQIIKIVVAK